MGSQPKETTTKVEPWDGAKPYLLDQYKNFDQLIKNNAPAPWKGPLIADQSQATKDSLNQAEQIARNGDTSALTNATNAVNSVMNQNGNTQANQTLSSLQNGVNLGTNPSNSYATSVMNGQASNAPGQFNQNFNNPALGQASGYGNFTNAASGLQQNQANQLASGNNPAMDYLRSTASGAEIGKNPYLDQMVSNSQDQIAQKLQNITNPAINSQAASLGRMGSGAFASQLTNAQTSAANEMAKVATDMYGNQYNADKQNQMAAAGQLGNFYNSDVSNAMNANQALSNTSNAQQSQRLAGTSLYGDLANSQEATRQNAANSLNNQFNQNNAYQMQGANLASNNYQSNIANMLGIRDQQMNAANSSLSAQNALNGQKLQAASQAGQTYQNQYLPSQALSGVGTARDNYATGSLQAQIDQWNTAQQQPLTNIGNFVNLLNGGGYSNTTQPVYSNTTGQALGALSSLAGLFSLCDVREKVIHALVGYMPLTNGNTIAMYEFSYRDDPDAIVWTGPIAQEVEEKTGAVIEFAGRKIVDVSELMKEAA